MAHFHAPKQKLFLEKTPRWQCKEVMFPLPLLLPWLVLLPPFCPLWSKPSWRKCFSASVLKANSITLLVWRERRVSSAMSSSALWRANVKSEMGKPIAVQWFANAWEGKHSLWKNFAMTKEMKMWSCPIYQWRVQTLLVNNFAQLNTIYLALGTLLLKKTRTLKRMKKRKWWRFFFWRSSFKISYDTPSKHVRLDRAEWYIRLFSEDFYLNFITALRKLNTLYIVPSFVRYLTLV